MTTYELPPEPPIGSRVRDHHGHVWTHTNDGWIHPDLRSSGLSWGAVMAYASPAELIEPDPWPTEPLIVATREGKHLTAARRVWARSDEVRSIYTSITDSHEAHPGDTFTDVVSVTVVPVAEMEALRASIKALGYGPESTRSAGSLLDTALRLLEATDALGVDL